MHFPPLKSVYAIEEPSRSVNQVCFNAFVSPDQLSDTGDVIHDEFWDVSSLSSFDDLPQQHFSDDDSISTDSNEFVPDYSKFESSSSDIPLCDGLQISKLESLQLVSALAKKANLSRSSIDDLLRLLKLHLPTGVKYPKSSYKLQKALKCVPMPSKRYIYCETCERVISNMICEECDKVFEEKQIRTAGNYFIIYDVISQFSLMLNNGIIKQELTTAILKRLSMSVEETQLLYGNKYTDIVGDWNLSATLNTDGVPVFKSSKYSLWPVLMTLNELPYKLRKNMVLLGALWCGTKKINIDMVFSLLVPELNKLQETGVMWTNSVGDIILSK
ncbi:unnamed protein product, partial [Allacma fusca]